MLLFGLWILMRYEMNLKDLSLYLGIYKGRGIFEGNKGILPV